MELLGNVNISPSCRKCSAEKETSVYILCTCATSERVSNKTPGRAQIELDQIKEVRLRVIVAQDIDGVSG